MPPDRHAENWISNFGFWISHPPTRRPGRLPHKSGTDISWGRRLACRVGGREPLPVPVSVPMPARVRVRFLGRRERRRRDRRIAWGVSPREAEFKNQQAAERRQMFCCQLLRLTPQDKSVAPPGLGENYVAVTWGSRPRLNIYRRSAAHRSRPAHDFSGSTPPVHPRPYGRPSSRIAVTPYGRNADRLQ